MKRTRIFEINKGIAMVIVLSMLFGMLGGMTIFAVGDSSSLTGVTYISANFDNVTAAEGTHNGMSLALSPRRTTRQGTPELKESANPYYGKFLEFAQTGGTDGDNVQWLKFKLDTPLSIGAGVTENTYAEFSYDVKLANASTGICFDFGKAEYANGYYMYQLNLNGSCELISTASSSVTHGSASNAGKNNVFHSIRVRVDLHSKTVVGIYVNDELKVDLASFPIALKNADTDGDTVGEFRIYIGKATVTDTLSIDNVYVATYTSTSGSPIVSKADLRKKIEEISGYVLSAADKTKLDSAAETAKNPASTQSDVNGALESLNAINVNGTINVVASETFDDGLKTTYDDFNVSYNEYANRGDKFTYKRDNPIYGNMFALTQEVHSSREGKTSNVIFKPKNTVDLSTANDGDRAELSFDMDCGTMGSTLQLKILNGETVAVTVNMGSDAITVVSDNNSSVSKSYSDIGLDSGYDKNIRVVFDMQNKKVIELYVNDVSTELGEVAMKDISAIDGISFNWGNDTSKVSTKKYTFAIDNLNLLTYSSASIIPSKTALRTKISQIYKYVLSDTDAEKLEEAAEVFKNPRSSESDITAALSNLNNIEISSAPKVVAFEDFENGAGAYGYDDFKYTTTLKGGAAKTETISETTDANPLQNKMFSVLHGEQEGDQKKRKYPVAEFTLAESVEYSTVENKYAEISFDVKTDVNNSTFVCTLYDDSGNDLGQINVANDLARIGVGYVDVDKQVGVYKTAGLEDGYNKNVKLVIDLYNKKLSAVYVNDVRLLDRTESNAPIGDIDLASDAVGGIAKLAFNWGNGESIQSSKGYTFAVDNIRVMTYTSQSPETDKSALIKAINANYATAAFADVTNAVKVYKDITATEDEVSAAAKKLLPAVKTYLSEITAPPEDVYIDKLTKPDLSADDITVTCTSLPLGYIDNDLNITQPTDESVDVEITYTLSRGDDTASVKYTVTVHPRIACEINDIWFNDALDSVIYSAQDGGKLKSVNLKKNTDDDIELYTAVYEDGILKNVKCSAATTGTIELDIPVSSKSEVKFFVWQKDTLTPVQKSKDIPASNTTLHIIGDSIYADYSKEDYKQYQPDYGIGQALTSIFADTSVTVDNMAIPGSTSKAWYDNGHMNSVLSKISNGDYVLISLCHNDQKVMGLKEYKTNLVRIANDVKEQGATPIFVTAVPRYLWEGDSLKATHGEYITAMKAVASENNILIFDLNTHLRELYTADGATSTSYTSYYSQAEGEDLDTTHLSQTGAEHCASWLVERFKNVGLPFVEYEVDK